MKAVLARNIDYWLGIPICFFLSAFHRLRKIVTFGRTGPDAAPKKIMFLELSEMGAAILAYSAMKEAQKKYPDAKLYFWIFKENEESVHLLDIIPKENVITMRSGNLWLLFIDTLKNLRRIRREKVDAVIDMELFSRFTSILTYLAGAKLRVGFHKFYLEGLYRGNMYSHEVAYNPYMHVSKNFIALVRSLQADRKGVPLLKEPLADCKTAVPEIKSSEDARENIWLKLKEIDNRISKENKVVILNPGAGEYLPLRRWPVENYMELAEKLLQDKETFIVLIGRGPEAGESDKIQYLSDPSRCINLIGKTTTGELVDLFNISRLFISHDSGAVNLASLTRVNIVVLFGPETPVLYEPLTPRKEVLYAALACSPCFSAYNHRNSLCRNNLCLKGITVEKVYTAAKRYL